MVSVTCQQCKKIFEIENWEAKRGKRKFCSFKCMGLSQRTVEDIVCDECKIIFKPHNRIQKYCSLNCAKKANNRNHTISVICNFCKKEFRPWRSYVDRGGGKYCSSECSHAARDQRIIIKCRECGKEFKGNKTRFFCSNKCCMIHTGKIYSPKMNGKWSKKYDKCISCGTTERNHASKGLCTLCMSRINYNPNANRRLKLKKKFGITLEQYNDLLQKVGGKCPICNNIDKVRLSVDHDHKTGRVRGLLCSRCNRALGYVNDDVDRLTKLIEYLKNPPASYLYAQLDKSAVV